MMHYVVLDLTNEHFLLFETVLIILLPTTRAFTFENFGQLISVKLKQRHI